MTKSIHESLQDILSIDGAACTALVDSNSSMVLGEAGSGVDMELAAGGNTEVVRAKMRTIALLRLNDKIDDILITLGKQYHVIRSVASQEGLFLYVVLDRRANLALARRKVQDVEADLKV